MNEQPFQKGRRLNDAFELKSTDSPFAHAVKELALARGLTARKFAEKLGFANQSTVTRLLEKKKRGTRAATAEFVAKKLEVPPAYLRVLAIGLTDEQDQEASAKYWRSLFDEAKESFVDGGAGAYQALLDLATLKLAKSFEEGGEVMLPVASAYIGQLRRAALACFGVREQEPDAMVVICRCLQRAGIDATQWLCRVSDTDLMDLYLALRSWPHKLAERQIEMRRQWLHDVGLYQDAMDLRLIRIRNAFEYVENQEN